MKLLLGCDSREPAASRGALARLALPGCSRPSNSAASAPAVAAADAIPGAGFGAGDGAGSVIKVGTFASGLRGSPPVALGRGSRGAATAQADCEAGARAPRSATLA
jgi:hypothetical protein